MGIDWTQMNVWAILAGGALYMIYGAIYYSILLKNKGEFAANESKGPGKYAASAAIAFISSLLIGILVVSAGAETWISGAAAGFIVGLIITLVYLKNSLFGLLSRRALFIAAGDHLIIFTLLGAVHGIWS
ncbi:DUF1761 domain-containing protein [Metabacillus sp. 113a]|uniref:DUF1761 domain-containing protein n=1 Tax=Metabacillus sp. 113a TaxID=3404706 RepID=UPI003CF71FED